MDFVAQHKLRDLVISSLTSLEHYRVKEREILVLCPFHPDGSPSCGVCTTLTNPGPGRFYCFTCGAKGSWNKLAQKIGFPLFHEQDQKITEQDNPFALLGRVMGEQKTKAVSASAPNQLSGLEPFPPKFSWRGLSARFLEGFGARYYWDNKRLEDYIYFPLTVGGAHKGYTLCLIHRTGAPGELKYTTYAATKEVYFLYDQVPDGETVVLNEGHFDALRLSYEGFFALAMFGVSNWGPVKKALLLAKRPKKVVICLDGDEAGYRAAQEVFKDLRSCVDVDIYYPPLVEGGKLDPGNMPDWCLDELRRKCV